MKIHIKRGKERKGPGDRSYLNGSTIVFEKCLDIPPPKVEKVGCSGLKVSNKIQKIHLCDVPIGKYIGPCGVADCKENIIYHPDGSKKLREKPGKCKEC